MSWNACSPTGGRSAAANWTDRGCKPGWTRLRANSKVLTPRCFGARLLLRGFQSGDLLRQSLGTVSGVVVVRVNRRCRAHEQPCGTHPALGRALAEERLWLPQRGGVSVCGADVDRSPNPAVAETSGAGLPVSRDRGASVRPARPAITGPGGGLNGYLILCKRSLKVARVHVSIVVMRSSGWGAKPKHAKPYTNL